MPSSGKQGTFSNRRARTVRRDGSVRFDGRTYRHPALLQWIGKMVMVDVNVFVPGAGATISECWVERVHSAQLTWRRQFHRTIIGQWICYCNPTEKDEAGPYDDDEEEGI